MDLFRMFSVWCWHALQYLQRVSVKRPISSLHENAEHSMIKCEIFTLPSKIRKVVLGIGFSFHRHILPHEPIIIVCALPLLLAKFAIGFVVRKVRIWYRYFCWLRDCRCQEEWLWNELTREKEKLWNRAGVSFTGKVKKIPRCTLIKSCKEGEGLLDLDSKTVGYKKNSIWKL